MSAVCKWSQEDDGSDTWCTDCGHRFCLNDGSPGDNGMKFCCYCGAEVDSVPWLYEDDDAAQGSAHG